MLPALQPRQMVESGLADMALAVARTLDALPPSARTPAVTKLLPLASHVPEAAPRLEVYARVWAAVLGEELQGSCSPGGSGGLSLQVGAGR